MDTNPAPTAPDMPRSESRSSADRRDGTERRVAGTVVLGMHRSGTSAATRVLAFLGLATCRPFDLIPALPGNERGHWESRSLTILNDSLLGEMKSAWWCPPHPHEVTHWAAQLRRSDLERLRAAHDDAHPATRPWVWKDPRICLTLPIWTAALAGRHATVLMIRHPLEIADSLAVRNHMDRSWALALWERYLCSALVHLEGASVWVARYSDLVTDPLAWCDAARGALRSSGLSVERSASTDDLVRSFVSDDLRHHSRLHGGSDELTERQASLWQWLDSSAGHHRRLSTTSLRSLLLDDDSPELSRHREVFIESMRRDSERISQLPG